MGRGCVATGSAGSEVLRVIFSSSMPDSVLKPFRKNAGEHSFRNRGNREIFSIFLKTALGSSDARVQGVVHGSY